MFKSFLIADLTAYDLPLRHGVRRATSPKRGGLFYFGCFMVRPIRFFFSSTSVTQTVTTSPTLTT